MTREEYWIQFQLKDGSMCMPTGLSLGNFMGAHLNQAQKAHKASVLSEFEKDIEKLGGLESIKPGGRMLIGQAGSFDIVIYRIN